MLEGIGRSPYSFTPLGITTNMILVGTSLIGTELSRSLLVNSIARRRPNLAIGLTTAFFTVLSLPLAKVSVLQTGIDFIKFTGGLLLPSISENALVSYLAYLGGPLPAMIYRGVLQAFFWFCPFLPDLTWATRALLYSFTPILSLAVIHYVYSKESREHRRKSLDRENDVLSWTAISIISVLLVWFSLGIFPLYPSVILSDSMQPGIKKGDIVLIKKVKDAEREIRLGDIVQFRVEQNYITHRIIEIREIKGVKLYTTKGDANRAPDPELVHPEQVKGKVIYVVPKIGWAALFLKTLVQEMNLKAQN
ncbi:signal peptidase I [Ammonifex thiophilus]|nr:signal peptidase I [Ammonifex thiophilus]